jgi:HD-GYP domain-containing protein (c-di-GMP phosphodiesterase class II)
LAKYGINGAYVETKLCDDVDVDEFIDPTFRKQVCSEIKSFYNSYATQNTISASMLRSVANLAESLLTYVISKHECLYGIIDMKDYDNYTYTHSMNVGILSILIGIKMGYSQTILRDLAMCGILHDMGKIDIPSDIINKNGPLTEDEFSLVKKHPSLAVDRLRPCCSISASVLSGILGHHEKFNGSGYPLGLSGEQIPIFGRILAPADVFDALTSKRSYRNAWLPCDAIEYMMGCVNSHFDMSVLQTFLKTVAVYPKGSMIQLSNNNVAVVVKNSPNNVLRPIIRIITPEALSGTQIDLSTDRNYLNVTVSGKIGDDVHLPQNLFA